MKAPTTITQLRNTLGANLRAAGLPETTIESRIIQEISRPDFNPAKYQPVPAPEQWDEDTPAGWDT